MKLTNLTNPGVAPVDGDLIRIEHENGAIEEKHYFAPVATTPPQPEPDPCAWLIDIGPFYDRFGPQKMAVLTCADPGVKAIVADLNIRKWVDLKRTDVAAGLAYVGTHVPAVDTALQGAILTTPVTADENRALRKLYFS